MTSTTATAKTQPRFDRYPVASLNSVAHLFPRGTARCGVYVLHFADQQRYVGQSLEVVARFASHRRRWPDIVALDFAPVRRTRLDVVEHERIRHLESRGVVLRNLAIVMGTSGECDLDEHIPVKQQLAWLSTGDLASPDMPRSDDPAQRRAGLAAFHRLETTGLADVTAATTAIYVAAAIPHPQETERAFWALSAMPATLRTAYSHRLATLSVNRMETFVIEQWLGFDEEPSTFSGFVVVSPRVLRRRGHVGDIGTRNSSIQRLPSSYATAGPDQLRIGFDGGDGLEQLWSIPGIEEAAREMSLRLMRKGPTFQWRAHNYELADLVFEQLSLAGG